MRDLVEDEPDDAIASKLIPIAMLVRSGVWNDGAAFRRKHLDPFKARITEAMPDQQFKVEAYGMSSRAFVPTIMLVARPIDAQPLEWPLE